MSDEELEKYFQEQLEIGQIFMKSEKDLTKEEIKRANEFLEKMEKENENSECYTIEECKKILYEEIERIKNEKLQNKNRKKCFAIYKASC